ncbi:MAG: bifunctional adenosylcobinamide kinase/adenosylcobinamide-phosphate guanylyltransferase [Synergistaceae bacterium]|nr:bifunctional adenosylcobinamide kinase/adenosylcobinamide-phosphate guanylyltransferase [Synergistaceae bacterium]
MGKRAYAEKLYGRFDFVCDLEHDSPENIKSPGLIVNLQSGVKNLLRNDINAMNFFANKIYILRDSVIVGDEISGGVVPVDKFERRWRDETGKIYQFLAENSDIIDRVFAGLPVRLKG